MDLDICICTHNPRRDVLHRVLQSIAEQRFERGDVKLSVLIVDNASRPPVSEFDCYPLASAGLRYRVVREQRLGNAFARDRAIAESTAKWVLFVDDDNELAPDYVAVGADVIRNNPQIGCFGGKLLLPNYLRPKKWVMPLLPYLAIRDYGDSEITRIADHWGPWEPATAGAFVHRSILELYQSRLSTESLTHALGRKGRKSLNSGEDSLLMHGAFKLGLANSYQPRLVLIHHIRPDRLRFGYFLALMRGYGRSHVILDHLCGRVATVSNRGTSIPRIAADLLRRFVSASLQHSLRYAVCMAAYRLAWNQEQRKTNARRQSL